MQEASSAGGYKFNMRRKDIAEIDAADNDFLISVKNMTENDIILNETAKTAKKPSFDFARYFILLVCVAIFVYSGYMIVEKLFSYAEAANDNKALYDLFYGEEGNSDADESGIQTLKQTLKNIPIQDIHHVNKQGADNFIGAEIVDGVQELDKYKNELRKFKDINPDTYGWIRVSGTKVDFPVVQAYDNDYYLRRNFWGRDQPSGSIFADFRNDRDVSKNYNTILYGHNMADDSMFGTLMNYWNKQNVFDSGIIELITETAIYRYEVFSVHQEVPTYPYIETHFGPGQTFNSFVDFINDMQSRSHFIKEGIEFNENSRMITLSTCTNTWRNPRLVVQGLLIEVVK